MPTLSLHSISKQFQHTLVVDDLSLSVENGELVCLLGPSGCGKTTTLRIVAGFENVDTGRVELDGVDITHLPPQKRDIGFVFQQYALFPHLTVAGNVGFGLKMRQKSRTETDEAVRQALELVRLKGMAERMPRQLSGGQQQRVALARALAIHPHLLLLDEPLSNLDAQLRDEMRDEIKRIQNRTGITAIFVTHDQSEALALADRVAVMSSGRLLQMDKPLAIYESPQTGFVSSFIGQSNILRGVVQTVSGTLADVAISEGIKVTGVADSMNAGGDVSVMIKKERVVLSRTAPAQQNAFPCEIESSLYMGPTISYRCRLAGSIVEASVPNHPAFEQFQQGDHVFIHWSVGDCKIFAH